MWESLFSIQWVIVGFAMCWLICIFLIYWITLGVMASEYLEQIHQNTVEPRYLELAYFELLLISKRKSGPCFNMKLWQQVSKLCGKEEKLLLFSTLFFIYIYIYIYIYISNFRSQITYSFVKCGCSIYGLPHSLNSDMSKNGYLEVFQRVP